MTWCLGTGKSSSLLLHAAVERVLYWDGKETAFVVKFLTYRSTERNRNYRHSL